MKIRGHYTNLLNKKGSGHESPLSKQRTFNLDKTYDIKYNLKNE